MDSMEDGSFVMRVHPVYVYLGYFCLMMCAGIVGGAIYDYGRMSMTEVTLAALLLLIFGACGIYSLSLYYFHKVQYSHEHIICHSYRSKVQTAHWDDIIDATYNPVMGYIKLYTRDKKTLVLFHHLKGIILFHQEFIHRKPLVAGKVKLENA
ncbi:Uncharacterised protein [Sphingobacterium spiritivorum]|uniref:Uncharacterized protein n=1 Tax=Sphingobacterium spiritivorum TaxID=258 RepID=A0A380CMN0_SPHSI|nr:hypothetical protein [Sphingobacterium spiritivorum]SUJ24335.1 Uncharacterised protein [Sphingobacterium spiritivorum]